MINLKVFTPKGLEHEGQYKHIQVLDKVSGSFGILENHAPVISTLMNGNLVLSNDSEEIFIALDEGVFKFKDNHASIVAEMIAFGSSVEDSSINLSNLIKTRKNQNRERNIELALAENELKKQIKKTGAGSL